MMSRYEITMEEYTKIINIEALTMINMAQKEILPAAAQYAKQLSDAILSQRAVCEEIESTYEKETVKKISKKIQAAYQACQALEEKTNRLHHIEDFEQAAFFVRDEILSAMDALRKPCDELETLVDESQWPFPTYGKLLFGIL